MRHSQECVHHGRALGSVYALGMSEIVEQFGAIDIYLFDQLLRGQDRARDAGFGCGVRVGAQSGLFSQGGVRGVRRGLGLAGRGEHPPVGGVAGAGARRQTTFGWKLSRRCLFPSGFADVVLSSAVLHFARGDEQFLAMLHGTWRVLKAGGLLFCRLASSIGMEQQVRRIDGRRLPAARRFGALPGGRGAAGQAHRGVGRTVDGPVEDHGGAESALHDHVGGTEERLSPITSSR